MNKKMILLIITFLLFAFSNLITFAETIIPPLPNEVLTFAEDNLEIVKSKLRSNFEIYGFTDASEVDDLYIDYGYKIDSIDVEKLIKSKEENLLNLRRGNSSELWQIIVSADGEPKSTFSIRNINNIYSVVQYGGNTTGKLVDYTINQFNALVADKNIKEAMVMKIGEKYCIVGTDGNEEYYVEWDPYVEKGADGKFIFKKLELFSGDKVSEIVDKHREFAKNFNYGKNLMGGSGDSTESKDTNIILWVSILLFSLISVVLKRSTVK